MTVFDGNFNIKEDLGFRDDAKIDGVITPNPQRGNEADDNAYFDMQLAQALGGLGNNSMFGNYTSPIKANESPTYSPAQAMADASPMTQLIKAIFGVDQLTGTFQRSRDEINDPHGDSSKLGQNNQNAIAQMTMMGIPPEIATSVIASTEPQPSPNPEGLYIRPNMLNQVPDSYSQAFKDANKAYMQNVAFRPSDFKEEIDLRGFKQLQGLLDNA